MLFLCAQETVNERIWMFLHVFLCVKQRKKIDRLTGKTKTGSKTETEREIFMILNECLGESEDERKGK